MSKSKAVFVMVGIITFLGFALRRKCLTPFYLYPDSYHYLWQARNIAEYQPIASGEQTIHFGYSFLSAIISFFIQSIEKAAYLVSFSSGVLAIPLIYLCAKKIFQSEKIGILASLFFAGSFNHSAWSGFVLSETSAIFFLLLAWVLLKQEKMFWAGLAQAVSIACRMEYALLVLPTLVFFFSKKSHSKILPFLLGLGLPLLILVRITDSSGFLIKKAFSYFPVLAASFFFSALCFFKPKNWLTKIAQLGLLVWLGYSILLIPTRATGNLLPWDFRTLKAWGDFALSDPFLVFLGLAGLVLVISEKSQVGFFFLASTLPLFLAYRQTNPISHRYLVHLTPILALSAGYFTVKAFQWSRLAAKRVRPIVFNPAFSLVISLFVFGLLLPIKFASAHWHPEENYEKLAAYRVEKIIQARKLSEETILATFSTPVYGFYTKLPVLKITETSPYLSFENVSPSTKLVLVVVDEAVRDQRPEFTLLAEKNLKPFLIEKSFINTLYLYANYSYYPEKPAEIYLLPTTELRQLLEL